MNTEQVFFFHLLARKRGPSLPIHICITYERSKSGDDMVGKKNSVLRIFWPQGLVPRRKSVVIGWRNGAADLVVVTALEFLDPSIVDSLLSKDVLLKDYNIPARQVYSICGVSRMSVLGTTNLRSPGETDSEEVGDVAGSTSTPLLSGPGGSNGFRPAIEKFVPHESFFNVQVGSDGSMELDHDEDGTRHPLKYQAYVKAFRYEQVQFIMFEPPVAKQLQYFSLRAISLELETRVAQDAKADELEMVKEKVREHADVDWTVMADREAVMKNVISQINCLDELARELRKQADVVFPKLKVHALRKRRLSMGEFALVSAQQVQTSLLEIVSDTWTRCTPYAKLAIVWTILVMRVIAEGVLRVLEYRVKPSFYSLKDLSATALQIDLRLQQFCYWPIQYLKIHRRSRDWSSNTNFNIEYIRFYNNIWLVLNDIIIGITMSKLILEHRNTVVGYLCYAIDRLLTVDFEHTVMWLMDWPGGLKLNTELASFFGELVLWVIQFWGSCLNILRPFFNVLVTLVAYSGFGGATLLISIVSDLVSFFPAHVYAFYLSSGRIYHWQLTVLRSLFHLFRGKKLNVLQNRVDSCEYELDQLLIGTILFMSLLFLLPTVMVFYFTFACFRLCIILVNAVLECALACLNHFPLFAILLRLKDSKRVPGGLRYRVVSENIVQLEPLPLPYTNMFYQFRMLSMRIRIHYMSFSVVVRLLSGQFVPIQRSKLYTMLYSQLPERRVTVRALREELNGRRSPWSKHMEGSGIPTVSVSSD